MSENTGVSDLVTDRTLSTSYLYTSSLTFLGFVSSFSFTYLTLYQCVVYLISTYIVLYTLSIRILVGFFSFNIFECVFNVPVYKRILQCKRFIMIKSECLHHHVSLHTLTPCQLRSVVIGNSTSCTKHSSVDTTVIKYRIPPIISVSIFDVVKL